VGVSGREFRTLSQGAPARETYAQTMRSANGRSMIVGFDRLDYSNGLEERFLGYERFRLEHPEERRGVFLLQIAPPSRASVDSYQRIRASLEQLSGHINGALAALDWVPLRYVNEG